MCEKKPKFPQIEAKLAEKGISYTQMSKEMGLNHPSNFSRRMNGEVPFDLAEIMWLMNFFDCKFCDLFSIVN